MARINVTERDLSWYTRQGAGPLTVYVPGVSTDGPSSPLLCNNINAFKRVFGDAIPGVLSRSYNIAASLLIAGASVLFHRFVGQSGDVSSCQIHDIVTFSSKYPGVRFNDYKVECTTGSSKGSFVIVVKDTTGEVFERLTVNFSDPTSQYYYLNELSDNFQFNVSGELPNDITLNAGQLKMEGGKIGVEKDSDVADLLTTGNPLNVLQDPYLYDFDVAISSGFHKNTQGTEVDEVDLQILKTVEARGTAIYLIDGLANFTSEEFFTYCGADSLGKSYAAAYGPWCYAKFLNTGSTSLLPASYSMLVQWIKSASEGVPIWMAPAGVKRASLGSFFIKPKYEIGKAILDMWQNNSEDPEVDVYKINPIMRAKNYGYVVYGNSTLLHNSLEGETSMLQSVGTRVLANTIKKDAFDIALSLQFDQMVGDLYAQFKTLLSVKLDALKYQGGLYDYRISLNDSIVTVGDVNQRRIPVKIQISPAPAVENFDITLEITKAGVMFSDDGTTTTVDLTENS